MDSGFSVIFMYDVWWVHLIGTKKAVKYDITILKLTYYSKTKTGRSYSDSYRRGCFKWMHYIYN